MKKAVSIFKLKKECKHSRVYSPVDERFPIKSIYVEREFSHDQDKLLLSLSVTDVKEE